MFSPLSGSPGSSPRSSSDFSEGVLESYVANFSLSEPLCDVLEAFRLFWDRELQMLVSGSQSPLDMILEDFDVVQKDISADEFAASDLF